MKKCAVIKWKFLAAVFAAAIAMSAPASALEFRMVNDFETALNAAVVYYDDATDAWTTLGWLGVHGNSTQAFAVPTSTREIYVHGELGDSRRWGDGDITRYVINEGFKYRDGQECPPGTNRVNVRFTKYTAQNNVVTYRPSGATGPLPGGGASSGPQPSGGGGRRQQQRRDAGNQLEISAGLIADMINNDRTKAGLNKLATNDALYQAALTRAREMTQRDSVEFRPDGRRYDTALSDYGVSFSKSGAVSTNTDDSNVLGIFQQFYESDICKRHMLAAEYTHIGVGIYESGGKYRTVMLFTVAGSPGQAREEKSLSESWKELEDSLRDLKNIFR